MLRPLVITMIMMVSLTAPHGPGVLRPSSRHAYSNLASALGRTGRHAEAIVLFTRVITLGRNFTDAYTNRGVAYYNVGDVPKARSDLHEGCARGDKWACQLLQQMMAPTEHPLPDRPYDG